MTPPLLSETSRQAQQGRALPQAPPQRDDSKPPNQDFKPPVLGMIQSMSLGAKPVQPLTLNPLNKRNPEL